MCIQNFDPVISKSTLIFLFIAATIVYVLGLFVNVMDVDAAQYASISREMLQSQHYLEVFHRGNNYLDKPPLLFWLSSLSFLIFGISNFAYKLPTLLFTLLAVYSTYRIGALLYSRAAGILSALLLYTCQAFFLFNNDVRTDGLLTANVAFACWQLLQFSESRKLINLLLGFTGVALAMMAKGPIGVVVPAAALFSHFAYRHEWKKIWWWQWYAGIAFALILMTPMLYGLYKQYGAAGPKFFFWTQSFGRITGENEWHNDAGYFYFIHNFLWSLIPWSVIAAFAICFRLYELIRNRFRQTSLKEAFSLGGFVLPFVALSFSHYKLPHYIFVLYPLCAVLTAGFITERINSSRRIFLFFSYVQLVVAIGITAGAIYLGTSIFPGGNFILWIAVAALSILIFYFFFSSKNLLTRLIVPSVIGAIVVNLLLSAHVYPALLKYQAGNELAAEAERRNVPKEKVFFYNSYSHSFEFYFHTIVPLLSADDVIHKAVTGEESWIIGGDDLIALLQKRNIQPKQVFSSDDFGVSRLTFEFLNPKTRSEQVKKKYLVRL